MDVGYAKRLQSNNNTVSVINSTFWNNSAQYGAGTYIFALFSNTISEKGEFINFDNCSWIENKGLYSPAVDISPDRFDQNSNGVLPIPVFRDCNFTRNTIQFKKRGSSEQITSGVFVITRFTVSFVGTLYFDSNKYTALLVNSGQIVFEENSRVMFLHNEGFRGGAVAIHGFAFLAINDNCTVKFFNNSATEYGGAIFYYPIEQRELILGRVCFLKYIGNHHSMVKERNISFIFTDNSASVSGSSIYSTTLFSCYYAYRGRKKKEKLIEFFDEIGSFNFDKKKATIPAIGTPGHHFLDKEEESRLTTLPGMKLEIPMKVVDELLQDVTDKSNFFARVVGSNTSIFLTSPYLLNRSAVLYGDPNEKASLVVSTEHTYRGIQYTINVTLLSCPPGYYHDNSTCYCSSSNKFKAYNGIVRCNSNFTAVMKRGYWAGHDNDSLELYTAPCPFDFCVPNNLAGSEYSLPNSSNLLSTFMCGLTRQGMLCGKCKGGYSIYYHSRSFPCGENDKCQYGILIYILSELLPVVIFFTIIVVFDVSFSSGYRNGFVFFSQMVTILPLEYFVNSQNPTAKYLYIGYRLIYGIFSIDFFTAETQSMSFCLFKDATVMDVLAFKCITLVFAFVLVVLLVVCIRYCTCCGRLCSNMKKKVTTKESVLNGLSAFLVICYVESVRVSFFILRRKILKGAGGVDGPVVAFFGGENYLERNHLLYAILAIVTLGTIGLLPPMLLLLYPSVLKLLEVCGLSEHRLVLAALRVTKINSLLPMLDVFQGHFKDNRRFFAGLYFLYRVALLVPYAFSGDILEYAIIGELIHLLILSFHSVAHPYKQNKHNIIDSLLFSNLAIVNGLSILMLKISEDATTNSFLLAAVFYFQLLLIYSPLLVLGTLLIMKACNYIRHRISRPQNDTDQDLTNYLEFIDKERDREENLIQEEGELQESDRETSFTY